MEYALIILKHNRELPSLDITDERVSDHVQRLSSKIDTKERIKLAAEGGTARKAKKRNDEAIEIQQASIVERVRHESKRGRVSMRILSS